MKTSKEILAEIDSMISHEHDDSIGVHVIQALENLKEFILSGTPDNVTRSDSEYEISEPDLTITKGQALALLNPKVNPDPTSKIETIRRLLSPEIEEPKSPETQRCESYQHVWDYSFEQARCHKCGVKK